MFPTQTETNLFFGFVSSMSEDTSLIITFIKALMSERTFWGEMPQLPQRFYTAWHTTARLLTWPATRINSHSIAHWNIRNSYGQYTTPQKSQAKLIDRGWQFLSMIAGRRSQMHACSLLTVFNYFIPQILVNYKHFPLFFYKSIYTAAAYYKKHFRKWCVFVLACVICQSQYFSCAVLWNNTPRLNK